MDRESQSSLQNPPHNHGLDLLGLNGKIKTDTKRIELIIIELACSVKVQKIVGWVSGQPGKAWILLMTLLCLLV